MPVGYRRNGVDFDALFDPFTTGTPPAATGLRLNGVDIAGRYCPISFGTKGPDVGYRRNGSDVSNLWAAIGTASYAIAGLNGKALDASDGALTDQPTVNAVVSVGINSTGGWVVSGGNSHGSVAQPAPTSGTWLPGGGVVADYQVQFDITSGGHADRVVNNGAPSYVICSTSRSASLELPTISGNNAIERDATASVRIRVRRISDSVVVSDTNITMHVYTLGYL